MTRTEEIKQRWPRGCAAPSGYCDWHEWAEAQSKQGLRQTRRGCGYWHFPQEKCEHKSICR